MSNFQPRNHMTADNQAVEAMMKLADDYAFSFVNDCDEKRTALRAAIAAALAAERQAERELWESAIGAVMPADFKDWHQNAASERPQVATAVIQSLRERESLAWDQVAAVRERALEEAYYEGWHAAAGWAGRDDLYSDAGSPTYDAEMNKRLAALKAKEEGK